MKLYSVPVVSDQERWNYLSDISTLSISKKIDSFSNPKYESWKKIQHLAPFAQMHDKKKAYALLSFFRMSKGQSIPFIQKNNEKFFWQKLARFERFFHDFSHEYSVFSADENIPEKEKNLKRRILRGFEEEAIASSLLEGANTTRKEAQEMIAEKRKPITQGEKMIYNNYQTILWIEKQAKNEPMSLDLIQRIHTKISKDCLDEKEYEGGVLRKASDNINVGNKDDGVVYYTPDENFVENQLEKFIDFANDKEGDEYFFHPLLKAMILHFMFGYLHPFCDGNGRTARAIFYWYLVRNGFPNIGYLPISTEIIKMRKEYDNSFIYTENEGGDMTFSIQCMVAVLGKSILSYKQYLQEESEKIQQKKKSQEEYYDLHLNERQIELLIYFQKYPEESTTFKRHGALHDISHVTARKDLIDLEEKNIIKSFMVGRQKKFMIQ